MRIKNSFILFIALVSACNTQSNTETIKEKSLSEKLDSQILAIHDIAMPKISTVLKLRRSIQNKIDTMPAGASKDSLSQLTFLLSKADNDMMEWMRQYHEPDTLDEASKISYLQSQLPMIEAVEKSVRISIQQANDKGFH